MARSRSRRCLGGFHQEVRAAALVVGLLASPARAAPTDAAQLTPTDPCWAAVEQHRAGATAKWTAGDPAGALDSRLRALEQAIGCEQALPEQRDSVQIIFENIFFQVEEGATLPTERADAVHRWYRAVEQRFGGMSSEAAEGYRKFSVHMPPPRPEPQPDRRPTARPEPNTKPERGSQVLPKPRPKPHRGLMLGGSLILAAGVGGVGAGFGFLGSMLAAQGKLNDLCTPACPDSPERTALIQRGELHEIVAPVLFAMGGAMSVAGGILLGLGVRRRNTGRFVPVLQPRYAGASWTVQF